MHLRAFRAGIEQGQMRMKDLDCSSLLLKLLGARRLNLLFFLAEPNSKFPITFRNAIPERQLWKGHYLLWYYHSSAYRYRLGFSLLEAGNTKLVYSMEHQNVRYSEESGSNWCSLWIRQNQLTASQLQNNIILPMIVRYFNQMLFCIPADSMRRNGLIRIGDEITKVTIKEFWETNWFEQYVQRNP